MLLTVVGIHAAKTQLQFKLIPILGDNKKGFFKYVNSKRRIRLSVGLLLVEDDHLTSWDANKADT